MNYTRPSVFFLLFLGFIFFLTFQTGFAQQKSCDCLANLNFLTQHIQENYIGYQAKVESLSQKGLVQFTDSLRKEAVKVGEGNCNPILWHYTAFFKDVHLLTLFNATSANHAFIRNTFAKEEKITWSEKQVEQYFSDPKNKDWIEGIWEVRSANYTIAIVKHPSPTRDFVGFLLNADSLFWMPGQVKLEIKKTGNTYHIINYNRDHIPFSGVLIPGQTLGVEHFDAPAFLGRMFFYKRYPAKKGSRIENPTSILKSSLPAYVGKPDFRLLDAETALLTLPSFGISYQEATDSVIEANKQTILTTKNLIIDIRNNNGGTVLSYWKLRPFLYTNPILSDGETIWATPTNIDAYGDVSPNPNRPDEVTKELMAIRDSLKQHPGELVKAPIRTYRQDTIYPYPAQVAVVMNEGSVSAAELFVLDFQQSKKVRLFGQPTLGGVDYLDTGTLPLPCPYYKLIYPLSRHRRMSETPLPPMRLQPHVFISPETRDWIGFVKDYLKRSPAKAQK
jgi:hypothetical protein